MLNENGNWVSKDQFGAHVEEEHDKKEKQHMSSDVQFEVMFEIPSPVSFFEKDTMSTWSSHLSQLEIDVNCIIEM